VPDSVLPDKKETVPRNHGNDVYVFGLISLLLSGEHMIFKKGQERFIYSCGFLTGTESFYQKCRLSDCPNCGISKYVRRYVVDTDGIRVQGGINIPLLGEMEIK